VVEAAAVTRTWRCRLGVIAAIASALPATPGAAQSGRPRESQEIEQLVVMIHCKLGDQETIGAGIIFGTANDRLYIVTANHVVRPNGQSATAILVELRALPGEPVPATLLTTFDAGRDLAVVSIRGAKALGVDSASIPFDRLGDPTALARGDGVYALGYPQGQPWGVNVAPTPVAATSDSLLMFESSLVSKGHSGGALLNQRWEIVGLLLNVQPPTATARSIAQVVEILRGWRYPVALRGHFAEGALEVVSAGAGFTCSVRRDGTAYCWGSNEQRELGGGSSASAVASPARVSTELKFASVSSGLWYACGLTVAGVAYCWGNVGAYVVERPGGKPGPVPGEPRARRLPVRVADDLTFVSLSAGLDHACGVTGAGAVFCWGTNDHGELGNGSKAGSTKPVRVASEVRFRSVSAGATHSCAVTTGGRTYCWGFGESGELGNRSGKSSDRPVAVASAVRFTSVSAGNAYTCAVSTAGAAYCWGRNEDSELGNGTTRGTTTPQPVSGRHVFRSVSTNRTSGKNTTCGVTVRGAALCWGWESEALGQFEYETGTPGMVVGDLVFQSVSVGLSHACGVLTDGNVYCWGDNRYGQLGDGSTTTRVTPAIVPMSP